VAGSCAERVLSQLGRIVNGTVEGAPARVNGQLSRAERATDALAIA
jgi:hypothetical protein